MPLKADPGPSKHVGFSGRAAFAEHEGYVYTLRALRAEAIHEAPSQVLSVVAAQAAYEAQRTKNKRNPPAPAPAPGVQVPDPNVATIRVPRMIENDTSLEPPTSYYHADVDDDVDVNTGAVSEAKPSPFRNVDPVYDPASRIEEPTERLLPFVDGGPPLITLWPDAYHITFEPEFPFEEEVECLAREALQTQGRDLYVPLDNEEEVEAMPSSGTGAGVSRASHEQEDGGLHDAEPEPVEFPPEFMDTLNDQVSIMLSRLFTHLTLYRTVEDHPRNILHTPMGWDEVLKFLDGSGIVSPSLLQTVRARIEAILGTPRDDDAGSEARSSRAPASTRPRTADLENILYSLENEDNDELVDPIEIFLQQSYRKPKSEKSRSGKKKGKRKASAVDDEEES